MGPYNYTKFVLSIAVRFITKNENGRCTPRFFLRRDYSLRQDESNYVQKLPP
jgi:hypothetical protein